MFDADLSEERIEHYAWDACSYSELCVASGMCYFDLSGSD